MRKQSAFRDAVRYELRQRHPYDSDEVIDYMVEHSLEAALIDLKFSLSAAGRAVMDVLLGGKGSWKL